MAHVQHNALNQAPFSLFGKRWSEPRSGQGVLRRAGRDLFQILVTWQQRSAERQHLATMSEFHLKDMGLSRSDAEAEASKPFWVA